MRLNRSVQYKSGNIPAQFFFYCISVGHFQLVCLHACVLLLYVLLYVLLLPWLGHCDSIYWLMLVLSKKNAVWVSLPPTVHIRNNYNQLLLQLLLLLWMGWFFIFYFIVRSADSHADSYADSPVYLRLILWDYRFCDKKSMFFTSHIVSHRWVMQKAGAGTCRGLQWSMAYMSELQ